MADFTPELIELDPQEAVTVRGDVPVEDLADFFGRAFHDAAGAAAAAGAQIVGPPFGFYPEMPTTTVAVEAGFPVAAGLDPPGSAHRIVLPGGRAVQATHVGPYDTLAQTYAELETWMQEHGLRPSAGMWECYLSDPDEEPDPATWRTRIVWPVA
jgi:effector-binding domain-containing protein